MLVGIVGVVLLGHVVTEEEIGQSLEAVGVPTGNPDRHRVVVADVDREGLAALAIEHDHASDPVERCKEVVLATLVVVEPADHSPAREGDVGLTGRRGQRALAPELHEPAAVILELAQGQHLDTVDHRLFAPFARTKSLTW